MTNKIFKTERLARAIKGDYISFSIFIWIFTYDFCIINLLKNKFTNLTWKNHLFLLSFNLISLIFNCFNTNLTIIEVL